MRRFILIFMALLFHVVSYPQKVTQSSYCYKDRKGIVYVRKYIVYNNTKEDLLTWISPFPVNKISDKRKVYNYFSKIWEDASLFSFFEDDFVLYRNNCLSIPGMTLIKRLPYKSTFVYILTSRRKIPTIMSNRIVILGRKVVEKCVERTFNNNAFYSSNKVRINIDHKLDATLSWYWHH